MYWKVIVVVVLSLSAYLLPSNIQWRVEWLVFSLDTASKELKVALITPWFCNFNINFHLPRPFLWENFYRHRHHHHHHSSLKADLELLQQYIHTLTSRLATQPRSTFPTHYEQHCKYFYFPQELITTVNSECVKGPTVFLPCPRGLYYL